MPDGKILQSISSIVIKNCNSDMLFHERADYQQCLSQLGRSVNCYGLSLHAFVLMPNQVCLLLTPTDSSLIIRAMDLLEQGYSEYFNFYYRRLNRLLEFDCSRTLIESDHNLLLPSCHMELMPVREGLVRHPSDYPWSSYAFHALGEGPGLLTPHTQYLALGPDEQARRKSYRYMCDEACQTGNFTHRAVA